MLTRNSQVVGTAAVTIIGDSPTPTNYAKYQVTILSNIAASIPMSIGTNGVLGITWRNINFVNSATGTAAVVSLRGAKNGFYNCQFISAGAIAITSTLGMTLIANSYIEGTDKLFSGYLGLYVFVGYFIVGLQVLCIAELVVMVPGEAEGLETTGVL